MNLFLGVVSLLVILTWSYFLHRIVAARKRFFPPEILKAEFQDDLPFASILLAARNEERDIARCVGSLLELDYPHYEIVVVNDRSTDNTLSILRGLQKDTALLKVVNIEKSQDGWSGKNYALHVGLEQARGSWFLFTDADTVHFPLSLRLGIQEAREHATGFLSLFSRMNCGGFWEPLIQPTASGVVTLWYPIDDINDPGSSVAFANGQYLLVSRETYTKIGGHLVVRDRLMEDVALSEEAKKRGIPFRIAVGTYALQTRMYRGFRASWNGWKRNFVLMTGGNALTLARYALEILCIGLPPLLVLLGALVHEAPLGICVLAGLAFFFSTAVRWVFSALTRQPRWPAFFVPLSTLIVLGILLNAMGDVLVDRGVVWRDVQYKPFPR